MAYTGPVPPTPTATSTDAQWSSWWAYQTALTNGRYDDERAARAIVLDAQHREKMAAEAACAEAGQANAAALRYAADAAKEPAPRWTEEQLVRQFMFGLAEAGVTGGLAYLRARASMLSLGDLYPAARPTPEGAPDLPPLPAPPKPTAALTLSGPPGEQSLPPAEKPQVSP